MQLTVNLHHPDTPAFPRYRKNFTTAYEVISRVGRDARKRGVDSAIGELVNGPYGAIDGYIVEKEPDENGENVILGTWSAK